MAGLSTAFVLTLALTMSATAQMTYRLKGTVKDNDGKPVAGARTCIGGADAERSGRGRQNAVERARRVAA